MSEDSTKETRDTRTFEERVFARFDSVDERFDRVEGRLTTVEIKVTNLEAQRYDTKPIWERALAEIAETNRRLDELQAVVKIGFKAVAEVKTDIEGLRAEMKTEFASVRHEVEHALNGVGHKIDALNQNILQVQADQRYVDRRLHELESRIESPG